MIISMKITPLVWVAGIVLLGCQSAPAPAEPETKTAPPATPSTEAVTPATSGATKSVKAGMTMQEVHSVKGDPKSTQHQHGAGPGGSEIDLWVYEDQTIRFQDGKVVE